jgi:hypothetical protein
MGAEKMSAPKRPSSIGPEPRLAMGEGELAQLAEPLSNIANRKGLRFAT